MDPLIIILIGTATVLFCLIRLKVHAAMAAIGRFGNGTIDL